jgi:aspartyl-tRNA(Asn)/glutamyl-tRNA(Gln) amidotransferase subunit A
MSLPTPLNTSLGELIATFDERAPDCVALTEACLARIDEQNSALGAFLHVDTERALASAREAEKRRERGKRLGPLDGIPIALKDNFVTQDQPTTAASRILENFCPPYDGTVVAKIKASGAVILGKLNMDEFAMGSSTEHRAYGACKNPWDLERTPGGSSGGSAAAVAAGLCFGSFGTDTGGSIRQPAAFCGVVGLKPTYGRVSRYGVIAFASSLDQVGPFAQDCSGAAHLLAATAGFDPRDSTASETPVDPSLTDLGDFPTGLRVGVVRDFLDAEGLDPRVRAGLEASLEALTARGAKLVDVALPHSKHAVATYYVVATAEASSNLARYDGIRFGPRLGDDQTLDMLYEKTRGTLFGDEVKRRIMLGTYVLSAGYYDAYYLRAQKVRRLIARDFDAAFAEADLLVCPTTPTLPFRMGEKTADPLQMYLSDVFTISANLAGLPALSVPVGFSGEGLPLAAHLMGPAFSERRLLQVGQGLMEDLHPKDARPTQ